MQYRIDINGLRGVAVLLVLLFHAGVSFFPSGFVGVDVFFVISGFLMTGVIQTNITNNSFSLCEFYKRRLWRLQPAMLSMLLLTFVIASVFYLPHDYSDFLKSARRVLLVTANQYFSHETTGYAAPDSDKMLLLHMWSLSIEWQWYIFFSLVYLLCAKYLTQKKQTLILAVVFVVSAILSICIGQKHPEETYYKLLSRVFEFVLGIIAYKTAINFKPEIKSKLSLAAIVIIVFCAMQKGVLWGYPNYWTFLVALCTATLLICGGGSDNSLYAKSIGFKPLVFIGDISYSLYLFHWPLLAALHYVGNESILARAGAIIIAFLFSILTYYWIEKPLRKKNTSLVKSLILLVLLPYLIIYGVYSFGKTNDQFSRIRFGSELARVNKVLSDENLKQREDCMNVNVEGTNEKCVVGKKDSKDIALLMGDSHSNQYWNFFEILGKDAGLAVDIKSTSLCLAFPGIYQSDFWIYQGVTYQQCHDNVKAYYDAIKTGKYKYVIISEVWENYAAFNIFTKNTERKSRELSMERIKKAAQDGLSAIVESGAIPVIVKSMYPMPKNYLTCFYEHFKTRSDYVENSCNSQPWKGDEHYWTNDLFMGLKREFPSLIIIDPKSVQCDGQHCKTEIDGVPLYRDVGHLNDFATKHFGKDYLRRYGNPLKSN
ncbi:TPA: acyltransferase [Escherichia coli]|nr:acyltransferase [Escherichia coli]